MEGLLASREWWVSTGRAVLLVVGLGGCVSQGQHDEVATERDSLRNRVTDLERQVLDLRSERDRARRDAAEAKSQVGEAVDRARGAEVAATRRALGLDEGDELGAVIKTRFGDIACELWPEVAPSTVRHFVSFAEGGAEWTDPRTEAKRTIPLYPGTVFHRVMPGFMIQGGDPKGDGSGGPGFMFEDEIDREVRFDKPGRLAMANSGPDTNGSQFFITTSMPRHLDGKHTIFGSCAIDVVQAIMEQPLDRTRDNPREVSRPREPVRIEAVTIRRG